MLRLDILGRIALTLIIILSIMASISSAAPSHKTVIVGGGLHGASCAFYLKKLYGRSSILLEKSEIACAASGKSGGFLAREWGSGPTVQLHQKSFDLHEKLAEELDISSFRRVKVLEVSGKKKGSVDVSWLDRVATSSEMQGRAAQVTPIELTRKLVQASGCEVIIGAAVGVTMESEEGEENRKITGVTLSTGETLPCDDMILACGPWSGVLAEDFFGITLPMQGVRSTSIVFPESEAVKSEFMALFCGEDKNGCHIEVYPRPDGSLYLCGLGGSKYVEGDSLRVGGDCYDPRDVTADPDRVEAALKSFRAMSSLGDAAPEVTQACMRPLLPDALPAMGRIPGVSGAFLSTGHNCWGVLWTPVSGYAMAELVVTGSASIVDLAPFSPARFMPVKARRGRKRGEAEVGEQW